MNEKNITRRDAIKTASLCGLGLVAAGGIIEVMPAFGLGANPPLGDGTRQYGFLMDTARCVNCGNCVEACRNYNDLPEGEDRRKVSKYEVGANKKVYVSTSCMHCENPSCMKVCPASAISKGEGGIVVVDKQRCIGCKYCYQACPYEVPHYNAKGMDKCDCCLGSGVVFGDSPHCVDACQYDALRYGPIEELVERCGGKAQRIAGPTTPSCYLT